MVARALLLVALSLAGCGSKSSTESTTPSNAGGTSGPPPAVAPASRGDARVIQRTQVGGVIELGGDRSGAMQAAEQEMSAHCGPNNFTIVQEGEEVVGADTLGGSGATVRTETAWRVHYQCNGPASP